MELLPRIFLGEGNASISLGGLRHFGARTVAIVRETAAQPICDGPAASLGADCLCDGHPCRQGTAAREAGKEAFAALVRENMWIPTLACVLYIIFVFHGPAMIRKPLPVPLPSSLVPARTPVLCRRPRCCSQVKRVLVCWNSALAAFSVAGAYHCTSALALNLRTHGERQTPLAHLLPPSFCRLPLARGPLC